MKIVSLSLGHNCTAAYFVDGECLKIYHEEKFNNIKSYFGLPTLALKEILKEVKVNDLDYISISSTQFIFLGTNNATGSTIENISRSNFRKIYDLIEIKSNLKPLFTGFRNFILKYLVSPKAKKHLEKFLLEEFKIDNKKIQYFDHHFCHCLTPFHFYNLASLNKDVFLVSLDGAGDFYWGKVYKYSHKSKTFKNLIKLPFDTSIGLLWNSVTRYLGMKVNEHEYKVMGLAAYVSDKKYYQEIYDKFKKIVYLDKKTLQFKSRFNTAISHIYMKENFAYYRFDNIAAALQTYTEDLIIEWLSRLIKKYKIKNIAFSGGVIMNVKLNQKIAETFTDLDSIYFQPSGGDESNVIGATTKIFIDNNIALKPVKTMYLGLDYSSDEIEKYINKNFKNKKYKITKHSKIENKIASLLSNFKVVALFRGKGEWGARSLCNRSILANGSDLKSFYEVNDMIKMRDFWMPFAPTINASWASKYIKDWKNIKEKLYDSTKYMIIAFNGTDLAKQHLRAAIHQKDKTLRPQIVDKTDNPFLVKVLEEYQKLTGMGGFMNTSLNIHGYPLVNSLAQAKFTLENSGLKYLVINNYLIEKL